MDAKSFLITLRKISFEKVIFCFLNHLYFHWSCCFSCLILMLPMAGWPPERLTSSHQKHWDDAFCLAGIMLGWTGWELALGASAHRGGSFSLLAIPLPCLFWGLGINARLHVICMYRVGMRSHVLFCFLLFSFHGKANLPFPFRFSLLPSLHNDSNLEPLWCLLGNHALCCRPLLCLLLTVTLHRNTSKFIILSCADSFFFLN